MKNNIIDIKEIKDFAIEVLQKNYVRRDAGVDVLPLWVTHVKFEEGMNHKGYLKNCCLPAHMAILPRIKEKYNNAGVVIGILELPEYSYGKLKDIFNSIYYAGNKGINPRKYYHAWIRLDINDPHSGIIDITSVYAENSPQGYVSKKISGKYIEILDNQNDVYKFHADLTRWRFSNPIVTSDYKQHSEKFLIDFAKQQGVDKSLALGSKSGYHRFYIWWRFVIRVLKHT